MDSTYTTGGQYRINGTIWPGITIFLTTKLSWLTTQHISMDEERKYFWGRILNPKQVKMQYFFGINFWRANILEIMQSGKISIDIIDEKSRQ